MATYRVTRNAGTASGTPRYSRVGSPRQTTTPQRTATPRPPPLPSPIPSRTIGTPAVAPAGRTSVLSPAQSTVPALPQNAGTASGTPNYSFGSPTARNAGTTSGTPGYGFDPVTGSPLLSGPFDPVTGRAAGVGEFGIDLRPPDPVTDPWGAGRAAEEGGPDQTNDYVDTAIDTIGGALPNVESIFDLSQNIGQNVPSPETTGYFSGGIEIPNFGNLPAVQALQGSVLNSLQNPDVISPEMQESLRGQAVDTILGGVRDTRRQVADEMARRGISDSGLATAVAQKGSRQATKDIQQAERDVAIQAALARRESELAAQQTAAALTGQLGQMGLGATNAEINRGQLGLQEYLGRSGVEMDAARLGLGAAQLETHILGAQAELEANRDVFVPNYMDEYTYNTMLDLMDRYHQDQLDEEERGFMWSIIGGLGQVFLPILAGVG